MSSSRELPNHLSYRGSHLIVPRDVIDVDDQMYTTRVWYVMKRLTEGEKNIMHIINESKMLVATSDYGCEY
jgi:hypothetical protein